ncbi:DUF2442 domain-containing protein [Granulicella sp. 5B5]|uniref:DUF2442 domain-containing protein n=1 Tax=Granulicella sp. 5B5 TaxID=1617967 RepID=UPI0015F6964D|nr:DUF2442 domain-containing protein [Granulicella sp. 5B5]QMV18657.1 DUF2442 domain-containing protein [Granulicella sp. 5B5]
MASSILDDRLIPVEVEVNEVTIHVRFSGGLQIDAPVSPFPRLANAQPEQRLRWQLNGRGYGIHWPDVDEDISVPGLLKLVGKEYGSALSDVA